MIERTVSISNRHPRLRFNRTAVLAIIATLDARRDLFRGGCPAGELSLAFLTDRALAQLHAEFLDDPTTTDVITFEGDAAAGLPPGTGSAGEICVSADTAAAYAREHGRDFSSELTLYVVHGWLHLAGYDDLQPAKKREMRRAEARAMKLLSDLRPRFTLRPQKKAKSSKR